MKQLWLVGQFKESTPNGSIWHFQGIFDSEEKADKACIYENYFYHPFTLNELLPDKLEPDDGQTVYPRLRREFNQTTLDHYVTILVLSARSARCLKNNNITTIRELVIKTDRELLMTKNFGKASLNEIKSQLRQLDPKLRLGIEDRLINA